jgi:hypothetical protein
MRTKIRIPIDFAQPGGAPQPQPANRNAAPPPPQQRDNPQNNKDQKKDDKKQPD